LTQHSDLSAPHSRIAIDYTPAYEQGGGIGRYVRELIAALARQPADFEYRLFVSGAGQLLPLPAATFSGDQPVSARAGWRVSGSALSFRSQSKPLPAPSTSTTPPICPAADACPFAAHRPRSLVRARAGSASRL